MQGRCGLSGKPRSADKGFDWTQTVAESSERTKVPSAITETTVLPGKVLKPRQSGAAAPYSRTLRDDPPASELRGFGSARRSPALGGTKAAIALGLQRFAGWAPGCEMSELAIPGSVLDFRRRQPFPVPVQALEKPIEVAVGCG